MNAAEIEELKKSLGETIATGPGRDAISQVVQTTLDKSFADAGILYAKVAARAADSDPYRTTIHFIAGAITFCLTLIVGIVNALPAERLAFCSPTYMMLGGMLASISLTALVATACMAFAQTGKKASRDKTRDGGTTTWLGISLDTPTRRLLFWLKLIPVIPAALATGFSVLAGWAMYQNDVVTGSLSWAVTSECPRSDG